ncbi:MAG: hypothetical protein JXR14_03590 [Paracoccaceae bacterium]
MQFLIPIGSIVTMIGLAGLLWCILRVAKAKKSGLSDDELRAALQSTVTLNLGALFLSAIGLMMVVIGITLG